MARRSKVEHLKSKVYELFRKGITPAEVRDAFPDIPVATIYVWRNQALTGQTMNGVEIDSRKVLELPPSQNSGSKTEKEAIAQSVECEIVTDSETGIQQDKVVPLPTGAESDFALVRRKMRAVLRNPEARIYDQAIAARLLLQAVEMRATLPAHVLDEVEKKTLQHELREAEQRSPEESARRFKDLLDQIG